MSMHKISTARVVCVNGKIKDKKMELIFSVKNNGGQKMRTRLTNAIVQMYFMTDFDIRPEPVHENPSTISLRGLLIILTITMKGGDVAEWLVRWTCNEEALTASLCTAAPVHRLLTAR